jgi:hemerythrin-like domain-containing protein
MKCKCLEALTAEHKIMLRIADVLDGMARRAEDACEYNQPDVENILKVLRIFGDDYHQAKEEAALFPAFASVCDASQGSAIRHMLLEHQHDRSLIEGMEDAVSRSDVPQFAEYARQLANLLRNHIYKEDNILFENIDAVLTAEADALVVTEFEAIDRDFQIRQGDQLLQRLRGMEWRYLRKEMS